MRRIIVYSTIRRAGIVDRKYAVNKRYHNKHTMQFEKDGAWNCRNFGLKHVGDHIEENDAVNMRYIRTNTVHLSGKHAYTASGLRISNVANGTVRNDAVNLEQLNYLIRYVESEMCKLTNFTRYSFERIYNILRKSSQRSSDDVEDSLWTDAKKVIEQHDKSSGLDWRRV